MPLTNANGRKGTETAMTPVTPRTRVLFIGGIGRSGSTLLNQLLGQVPGYWAIGELDHLWSHSLRQDVECGCNKPFRDCEFWSQVGERAFGGWSQIDLDKVHALQRQVEQTKRVPLLLAPRLLPSFHAALRSYADLLGRVYATVGEVSGAAVVVDSSKSVAPLYVRRHIPGVDLRVVQLVRDPRGVAYSWSKTVQRPEQSGHQYMAVWSPRLSSRRWMSNNLLVAALDLARVPRMRVRYEDMARDPGGTLRRILTFAGTPPTAELLRFVEGTSAELRPTHTAYGNPMRFDTGRIQIRLDEAWRKKLPRRQRGTIEVLTWPLRLRYGYRGPAGPPGERP